MKINHIISGENLTEFVPPGLPGGGGENDRNRRLRKLLEIAIQVAKEKNVDELGMIHAMNMIAGDDFFTTAVEGILPDITDKEYMGVLQTAYKTLKQGMSEEFRPTAGQAMGIRSQIAKKMNPDNNKLVWKRPNQIMGSHTENELRVLKFKYSAKHNVWGGTQQMWARLEGTLKELAPGGAGRGGDNYFKTLASVWYGGAYNTGSLQRGIKSQQDVERILQGGIVCPDGVTRKFGIDYNAKHNGVVISSDDHYEHADHGKKPGTMIDVRTGQPWGPYDYMEFSHADLSESLTEFAPTKPPTAGADGEMATTEGFRVPAQQILGTKNRAKSAYYPTNVKPKVPRLDKPLTDQELVRLTQLAGLKSNK